MKKQICPYKLKHADVLAKYDDIDIYCEYTDCLGWEPMLHVLKDYVGHCIVLNESERNAE